VSAFFVFQAFSGTRRTIHGQIGTDGWQIVVSTTIASEQIDLDGGARLSFLKAGPMDGQPLILLHGIPTGAELWRGIMPSLAEVGYRCFAPNLPGYGTTRIGLHGDYSIFGSAQLIDRWLEVSELEDVWLVGHDWGGAVAQVIAARYSDRLSRLTLSNCPVEDSWPVPAISLFRLLARAGLYAPSAALRLIPNPYATSQLNKAFYDRSLVAKADWNRIFWDSKVSDAAGRAEFQHHLASLDNSQTIEIAPELRLVDTPALLVWGSNDRFQPWERVGVRLKELLPNPEIKLIERAGHFHVLEKPDTFVEALIEWRHKLEEPI